MCLSTVYDQNKNKLCENIMMMNQLEDGRLDFINLMGVRTSVYGSIEKINLMDNYIYVKKEPGKEPVK